MRVLFGVLCTVFLTVSVSSLSWGQSQTERIPVLSHISHPHTYYWRELYMPQLTAGPSAATWSPDGKTVVYSMQGSLWRQEIDSDTAYQLTTGPGYDYQPDWSPDGRHIVFTRHHGDALNLYLLDLESGKEIDLTNEKNVNLEPRWSPDGKRLAFVSSRRDGYFGLYVAEVKKEKLKNVRVLVAGNVSKRDRYYYSQTDHAINPSWSPDGGTIYYVSNPEDAWGTGGIWSVNVENPKKRKLVVDEETSWSAHPEMAHDGKRLLYSSYERRQWHQLWLTTPEGLSPLPLTFGDFDLQMARWSPDDRQLLYTSNETGGLTLWRLTVVGGAREQIRAVNRVYRKPMTTLSLSLQDEAGKSLYGRVMVRSSDGRHYGPDNSRMHADDYIDPKRADHENHYFHCFGECSLTVPQGDINVMASSGFSHRMADEKITASGSRETLKLSLASVKLPPKFGDYVSADMHVHMNYGGKYRQTLETLARDAKAEDVDVIYNLLVNKEQRIPDISQFKTTSDTIEGVTIYQAQEYHTSYWGHLSFLHLDDHLVTPDFASYRHTAMASPYPSNGVVTDLAHAQGAVVGYVHPFDAVPDPSAEGRLSHSLPVDVVNGKTDFLEVVSFANHQETAAVWYKFLNLGYRLTAGAGTDAMTNYASLRGPVGLNRAYLQAEANNPDSLKEAIRLGHGYVTNGPNLGLLVKGEDLAALVGPGHEIAFPEQGGTIKVQLSLRSAVPVRRLELVQNGRVIRQVDLGEDLYSADATLDVPVTESGWILLRAVNEESHPMIQDLYTYATTNPVWLTVENKPQSAPEDARYLLDWIGKIEEHLATREEDFNAGWEKDAILKDIEAAKRALGEKINAAE
ncbi:CehA/McbA family metallohydrolase [Emcibacter sp.]|uniref:CehA/McbA family metallohydrolase n=1 Tax=Emcibacter sp. TaxID=1979954 RepID=UPI002AA79DF5|nr:CehA/McbA family metallohydrolase [Emcibacter sp.]